MNPQDIAQKYGATFTPSQVPTSNQAGSGALASVATKYGATFTPTSTPSPAPTTDSLGGETKYPTVLRDIASNTISNTYKTYSDLPSKLGEDINAGASDIQKGISGNENSVWSSIGDVLKGVVKSGARTAGDVANAIYAPISNVVGGVLDKTGINDAILHSSLVDELSNQPWLQKFAISHPNAGEDFGRALTLAMSGQETGKINPKAVVSEVKGYMNAVTGGVKSTVSDATSSLVNAPSSLKGSVTDMAVNSEKSGWSKPTETPKAAYNKATDIYNNAQSQGHDISDTLVNNGIKLSDHIEQNPSGNKVFNTSDTADILRQDAAKTSNEVLRPSLLKADAIVPKVPVKDVIDSATDRVRQNNKLTSETKDAIIEKLKTTQSSLEKANPDGMKLSEMHDEKITRDLNSKYNPLGDIASNMEAVKNKALADALRAEVEGNAPKDIPVKEFNAELSKQYQSASYLDALHGKSVPKGVMSKLANFSAKVVGAKVGSVVGGGIFGGVAGYHIGGLVESMIENLPNPIRNSLLNNLEKTNPEAFKKVTDYLNNRENNGSVKKPISSDNTKTSMDNNISQNNTQGQQMGTYKLQNNPSTGRVEPTGQFRKPNANFYPKESNLKLNQRKYNITKNK